MVKYLLCLLIGLFSVLAVSAQEQISIKINDQYESRLDSVKVQNNGAFAWYKPDNRGMIAITYNPADSVIFSSPGFGTTAFAGPSLEKDMLTAAKNLEFEKAASIRDAIQELKTRVA